MRFAAMASGSTVPPAPSSLTGEAIAAMRDHALALRPFDSVSGAAVEELLETRSDERGRPRLALTAEGEEALGRVLPHLERTTAELRELVVTHPRSGEEEHRFASDVLARMEVLLLGLQGATSPTGAYSGEALERLAGAALDGYREVRRGAASAD